MGVITYLLGLILVALWWMARPRLSRGLLLGIWCVGALLMRFVPILVSAVVFEGDEVAPSLLTLLDLFAWLGSILLLRAFLGLTGYDRPWRRRTKIWFAGLLIYLIIGAFNGSEQTPFVLLAIPWLWSFRWREGLGAGLFVLVSVTALLTMVLCGLSSDTTGEGIGWLQGLGNLAVHVRALVIVYAFLAIFAAAARIHLSIRRISNRLVSSHLLAGIVPVLLTILFLALAAALFLSTYRGSIGSRLLTRASIDAKERIVEDYLTQSRCHPSPFGEGSRGQIVLIREGEAPARVDVGSVPFSADSLLDVAFSSKEVPLLWDGRTLFLRARFDTVLAGRAVLIEALTPIDSLSMVRISEVVGVSVRVNPFLRVMAAGGNVQIGGDGPANVDQKSIGPDRADRRRLPGGAIVNCLRRDGGTWVLRQIPITSSAGFVEPLFSLFGIARENPLATVVLVVLGLIAAVFLGVIWVTSTMVFQMGRSIAQAVRALTRATAALGEGKLEHRVEIAGKDELWEVAASFNQMADGLERMRSVERATQRLEEELRLAREIQTRLLPSGPPDLPKLELAGISLPARQVGGDYFDYLPIERGRIGITVADVSGKGAPAALLMSSFRASLRTQDLERLGPAEVLGRLNRFIHGSVDPGKFITAFLGLIDPAEGTICYANAGHDPPLVFGNDGSVEELTGGGLILGMLPQIVYEEAAATMEPGALLAVFTDGVTEARNPDGEFFGVDRLKDLLQGIRTESCEEIIGRVVRETKLFSGDAGQYDDITMILAKRK